MGYYTEFDGSIEIAPQVSPDDETFIRGLTTTRRMARNLDPEKYGVEGEFFFDLTDSMFGQTRTPDIIDYNSPPRTQPSLWCPWQIDGNGLNIPEEGKHYRAVDWLVYLIERVLKPRGYTCQGSVIWFGEDREDVGRITVKDNVVTVEEGRITFDSPGLTVGPQEFNHVRFERKPCLISSQSQ